MLLQTTASLAILLTPAHAGIFRYRSLTDIDLTLDTGPARPGEVIPGHPIPLTVRLKDNKGNVRTTDGALPNAIWRKLDVQVDGGTFDPSRAVILPEPAGGRSIEQLEQGALSIRVRVEKTPGITGTEHRTLDWRAVHGPPASEVTRLTVRGTGTDLLEQRWLLPGSVVQLTAEVQDDSGRAYRTDTGPVRIPWSRFTVDVDGLQERDNGTFFAERKRLPTPYSATVTLPDAPLDPLTVSYTRDWERVDGPAPEAITRLTAALVVPRGTPDGELPPGSVTPLRVTATTKEGRTFTTDDAAVLSLPADRLVVTPHLGTWSPGPRTIRWSDDLRGVVGKRFRFDVQYESRPDTKLSFVFQPDFLSILAPWSSPGKHRFQENDAPSGQGGRDGVAGRDGTGTHGAAEGGNGGDGGDGQAGAPGPDGPHVQVTAWSTTTLDGRHPLVVYVIDGPGGRGVHVHNPANGPVRIVSKGGNGGHGGVGGEGGRGGSGGPGCGSGNGGTGGDGGKGGPGGAGGSGGRIVLRVDHSGTASHFDLRSKPGEAGHGGRGGGGGRGGDAGQVVTPRVAEGQVVPSCTMGNSGARGSEGPPGPQGPPGAEGRVRVQVDPGAVSLEAAGLPPKLREALP